MTMLQPLFSKYLITSEFEFYQEESLRRTFGFHIQYSNTSLKFSTYSRKEVEFEIHSEKQKSLLSFLQLHL